MKKFILKLIGPPVWAGVWLLPVAAVLTIAAGISRPQPMPVLWDDGHGFTIRLTTNGWVTQRGTSAPVTNAFAGGGGKVYSAYFDPSTTNALVFENSLGFTPVWEYSNAGLYYLVKTNSFDAAYTFVLTAPSGFSVVQAYLYDPDIVEVDTTRPDTGLNTDAPFFIEVRIYP